MLEGILLIGITIVLALGAIVLLTIGLVQAIGWIRGSMEIPRIDPVPPLSIDVHQKAKRKDQCDS